MNSGQTSRRQHDFDAEATYTDNVGTEWHIGVEIKINEPPMHRCVKRGKRAYALERINKKPSKLK